MSVEKNVKSVFWNFQKSVNYEFSNRAQLRHCGPVRPKQLYKLVPDRRRRVVRASSGQGPEDPQLDRAHKKADWLRDWTFTPYGHLPPRRL